MSWSGYFLDIRPLLIWIEVTFGINDVYDISSDEKNPRKNNQWTWGAPLHPSNVQFLTLAAKTSSSLVIMLALPAAATSLRVLGCTAAFSLSGLELLDATSSAEE